MKTKEIEALENYIKTENEHWNKYTFEMLCEVLQQRQFDNPETPLRLFNDAINTFTEQNEHPLKAVQMFTNEIDKQKINPNQKLFVYEWVCKYLKNSEFDFDHEQILDLLNIQKEKLKSECQPVKPLTKNIQETLKEIMQKEFENLTDTLKSLEPVQRLNILCKLMPFVLPKVESIKSNEDELFTQLSR